MLSCFAYPHSHLYRCVSFMLYWVFSVKSHMFERKVVGIMQSSTAITSTFLDLCKSLYNFSFEPYLTHYIRIYRPPAPYLGTCNSVLCHENMYPFDFHPDGHPACAATSSSVSPVPSHLGSHRPGLQSTHLSLIVVLLAG